MLCQVFGMSGSADVHADINPCTFWRWVMWLQELDLPFAYSGHHLDASDTSKHRWACLLDTDVCDSYISVCGLYHDLYLNCSWLTSGFCCM